MARLFRDPPALRSDLERMRRPRLPAERGAKSVGAHPPHCQVARRRRMRGHAGKDLPPPGPEARMGASAGACAPAQRARRAAIKLRTDEDAHRVREVEERPTGSGVTEPVLEPPRE